MAAKTWTGQWWTMGGGGTVWNSIVYDPEFNQVYIGTKWFSLESADTLS